MITDFNQLDLSKTYSYIDYLNWSFPERVELFEGKVHPLGASPDLVWHHIRNSLMWSISEWKKEEFLFTCPFDILFKSGKKSTVVQPDIGVVIDRSKLTDLNCTGAPEFIIEILSPERLVHRKLKEKFHLYEQNGVIEYWIVDPIHKDIVIYSLNDKNKYIGSKPFVESEIVESEVLKGLKIDVVDVFKE